MALVVVKILKPKLFALSNDVAKSNADISHFLFESLSNTAIIRAFGAEQSESDKLKKKQSVILGFLLKYQVLGAVSGSVPMAGHGTSPEWTLKKIFRATALPWPMSRQGWRTW